MRELKREELLTVSGGIIEGPDPIPQVSIIENPDPIPQVSITEGPDPIPH